MEIGAEKGDGIRCSPWRTACSSRLAAGPLGLGEHVLLSFTGISVGQAGCSPLHGNFRRAAVGKALRRGILFLTRKAEPHLVMTSAQHACAPYA